jgi:magnesium-transporting ATPase (P-type)
MRSCPSGARFLLDDGSIDIQRLSGVSLHYESPSTNLYKLNGEMVVTQENENVINIPISMDNILLRGSRVRNSASVYGIVLYTGKDTRLSMNSNKVKSSKFSTIERFRNKKQPLVS